MFNAYKKDHMEYEDVEAFRYEISSKNTEINNIINDIDNPDCNLGNIVNDF